MRRPEPSAELSAPPAGPPGDEAGALGGAAGPPGDEAGPSRGLKVAAVALAVAGLVAAQRAGLFALFAEPARVKQALVALGPWGYAAFVGAYAALQPFGVPGTAFVVAAPLIWPWPVAFALSMAGTMAASVVGFSFARFVARDWVARRVPARFRAHDRALAERGFATVFALRFIFWMPPMLHAFFGISRVRFWTHFWGSAAGYLVPLLATAYFGEKMFDAMRAAPPSVWAGLGAATAASLAIAWLWRRRAKRARAADLER
ncbi:MAG TPA: VTT domain-containing protein [Polyangiaceae bacterium]|nr:VTT domain-containing protein [Polyangiaceae bacterium]